MRTATTIEGSGDWSQPGSSAAEYAREAEKLGLDICWVAEAWGADAPSLLGYLAARTSTMLLGSAVLQVGTRSPVLVAQTAMTLVHMSGGRFLLGLGVSGPGVIEGLHGVGFAHPLARMRETVQIVRSVFTGEKVSFAGAQYQIPRPGGQGRPMRVGLTPVSVPVYLAALSPKMLELTGELADGWLGTSFVPEGAAAYFTHLDAGLARAGRTRASLDICQGAEVNFTDEAALSAVLASRRKELAFSLGGMGTATSNYYNDAYSRQGWADVAAQVRERWQSGDRDGAAALVTDDMPPWNRLGKNVPMSNPSYSESIIVAIPPDSLYDLISDVTRMGEWSPICKACWWDEGDGPRPGAWFTGRNELPERTWETRSQVVVADRGREFAWEVNNGWVRWSYTFTPVEAGTQLTESWEFLPAGIAGFHERYGERAQAHIENRTTAAHTSIPQTLIAIKQTAETP